MDPLPPPITAFHGPSRGHLSRSSTRGHSPQESVNTHHATAPLSRPLTQEQMSMASIESYSGEADGLTAEDPESVVTPGTVLHLSQYEVGTARKRKRENGTAPSESESSLQRGDILPSEMGEEQGSTHTSNTMMGRACSVKDIMDVDASPATTPTYRQERPELEGHIASGSPTSPILVTSPVRIHSSTNTPAVSLPKVESLSSYNCPICFSPPNFATLTPCGHICCGECLFSAIRSSIERAALLGPAAQQAKCPVCRAPIPSWDGKGGGVIALKPRVLQPGESR